MIPDHNQLSTEDLIDASNFIVQYLRDSGFEGNLDDGTALYDLLIKPLSLLYALFSKQVELSKSYFSLGDALKNKEALGPDYNAAIDSILSNWFIERKGGSPTAGTIRMVFTRDFEELTITSETTEFYFGNTVFKPRFTTTFNRTNFKSFLGSNQRMYYYIELPVTAISNRETVISEYERFTTNFTNVYLIRIEAAEQFIPGESSESSENYVSRAKHAITTRELISEKAIITEIRDKISSVKDVFIAGHGSREQLRDIKEFQGITVNVGNKADIYPYAPFQRKTLEFEVTESGKIDLSGIFLNHIFSVKKKDPEDSNAFVDLPYKTNSLSQHDVWAEQSQLVLFSVDFIVGEKVLIDYLTCQDVVNTSNLVFQDNSLVTCYSPIIKSFYPVILRINADCRLDSKTRATRPDSEWERKIATVFTKYVEQIPNATLFTRSELVAFAHNNLPELKQVLFPLSSSYQITNPYILEEASTKPQVTDFFSTIAVTGSLPAHFVLDAILPNSVSRNTIKFYTDLNLISVAVRS